MSGASLSRTPVIIAGAVLALALALVAMFAQERQRALVRVTAEHPDGEQASVATAGRRDDATAVPRRQIRVPRAAAVPLPTMPERIFGSPVDADRHVAGAYRSIGEHMNPDQEHLPGEEPVAIGEVLDADDPDAGPVGGYDGDPRRLGVQIDADSSKGEVGDLQAERSRIGEALNADMPDDAATE